MYQKMIAFCAIFTVSLHASDARKVTFADDVNEHASMHLPLTNPGKRMQGAFSQSGKSTVKRVEQVFVDPQVTTKTSRKVVRNSDGSLKLSKKGEVFKTMLHKKECTVDCSSTLDSEVRRLQNYLLQKNKCPHIDEIRLVIQEIMTTNNLQFVPSAAAVSTNNVLQENVNQSASLEKNAQSLQVKSCKIALKNHANNHEKQSSSATKDAVSQVVVQVASQKNNYSQDWFGSLGSVKSKPIKMLQQQEARQAESPIVDFE